MSSCRCELQCVCVYVHCLAVFGGNKKNSQRHHFWTVHWKVNPTWDTYWHLLHSFWGFRICYGMTLLVFTDMWCWGLSIVIVDDVNSLLFFCCSDKFTRFCQWKNLELNIQVYLTRVSVIQLYLAGPQNSRWCDLLMITMLSWSSWVIPNDCCEISVSSDKWLILCFK